LVKVTASIFLILPFSLKRWDRYIEVRLKVFPEPADALYLVKMPLPTEVKVSKF
jgi:hypothetical protein